MISRKILFFLLFLVIIFIFFDNSNCKANELSNLFKIALDYDPHVRSERELLQAEISYLNQARSAIMPNIQFDASYTAARYERNTSSYNFFTRKTTTKLIEETQNSYNYNFTLEQPIYDREALKRIQFAKKRVEYQELKLQKAEQDLAIKLAEAYCTYLIAKSSLLLSESEKEAYFIQWKKLEDSLALGLSTKMDTLEAHVQYELAVANVIAKNNELLAAIVSLEKLTGTKIEDVTPISLDEIKRKRVKISLQEWMNYSRNNNLDVLISKKNTAIAEENKNVVQSKYYPKFSIIGRYSDTDSLDTTIGGEDMRVLFRFNMPIYTGGRISYGVEEATKRLESYKEQEKDILRKIETAVVDTFHKFESSILQVDAHINALKSAELYLEATEEGYNLRLKSLTDLLNAKAKVFKIKRDLITYSYNEYLNLLKLKAFAGEKLDF